MSELDKLYVELLYHGLVAIRNASLRGDLGLCQALSELLHEVPSLIGEVSEEEWKPRNTRNTRKKTTRCEMGQILFKDESYRIMRACFEVYKEMGCGLLEAVYQECLEIELASQGIVFRPQADLVLCYKGKTLKQAYTPDFICWDKIILEIKAVKDLAAEHRAQVHNYLHATGYKLGLLVNFGHYPKVEYERVAL